MSDEINFELSDENVERHAMEVGDEGTRAFRRLLALPRRGTLLFRDNDGAINWERPVNKEAILGQTRGEVTAVTCGRCQNGLGPFNKCVVVENFFSGSCTNCHYNSQGSRCNLRGEAPPRARPAAANASGTSAPHNITPKGTGAARSGLQKQPPHGSDTLGVQDRGRHLSRQDMIQRGKEFLEMGRQLLDDIEEWTRLEEGVARDGQDGEAGEEGDSNAQGEQERRDGDGQEAQGEGRESGQEDRGKEHKNERGEQKTIGDGQEVQVKGEQRQTGKAEEGRQR